MFSRKPEGHVPAALAADPGRPLVLNALATALASNGQVDEAVVHYRQALVADPELLDAHYNLALLLLGRGETREAREHLTKARALAAASGATDALRAIDYDLARLGAPAPPSDAAR